MSKRIKIPDKKSDIIRSNFIINNQKAKFSQPKNYGHKHVSSLQKNIGDEETQRFNKSGLIQPKLRIGKPKDKHQQEADRVAEEAISVTPDLRSHIQSLKGSGQPLPQSIRKYFEPRFGHNFSQVRIHKGDKAAKTAKSINAKAFTAGKDIMFDSGQYAPEKAKGRSLLAHELAHTIQQEKNTSIKIQKKANDEEMTPVKGFAETPSLFSSNIQKPIIKKTTGGTFATVYFGKDSILLFRENLKVVEKISEELRFMSDPTIIINGHASTEGTKNYNQKLSDLRRLAVVSILRSKPRIGDALKFSGKAYGETKPVIEETGKTDKERESNRAFNRRVEIIILHPTTEEPKPPPKEPKPAPSPKKPIKLKDLFPPIEYKPETMKEKLDRIIKEKPPTLPKKRSISELVWKKIDEKIEDILRKTKVPRKYRERIKSAAREAIKKGAEKILDTAMDAAGLGKREKEMIKKTIEAGAKVPVL